MDDLFTFLIGDISDFSVLSEFTVMVRLIAFSLVIEAFGVCVGHISSVGR